MGKRRQTPCLDEEKQHIEVFEKITGRPVCFGEWSCLTDLYPYRDIFDGQERWEKCQFHVECKEYALAVYEEEREMWLKKLTERMGHGTAVKEKTTHATVQV
jgi:hypothetical protein